MLCSSSRIAVVSFRGSIRRRLPSTAIVGPGRSSPVSPSLSVAAHRAMSSASGAAASADAKSHRPFSREPSSLVKDEKVSIWTEFTMLAVECGAVNLGQGFPDGPMPEFVAKHLADVAAHPEKTAWHQYARGFGHARLTNVLGELYTHLYGVKVNAQSDVLVTVGAYLSLYYAFLGWINRGDEVIILEPAYDSYVPQVRFAAGVPVPFTMDLAADAKSANDYRIDFDKLEKTITPRTKMLVLNNPHNPTGKLFTRAELEGLARLAEKYDLLVLADEVYEWHVYPDSPTGMIRFASLPGMYERTISIGSAGKAFSVTGWKLGWAVGPAQLLGPLKSVHQNCIFTCSTPTQEAVARAFEQELPLVKAKSKDSYLLNGLAAELVQKRDRLTRALEKANFGVLRPEAGYFMLAHFKNIDGPFRQVKDEENGDPLDFHFARWLCREKKLATIPPSAFYSPQFKRTHADHIRLCFFKTDETLSKAEAILKDL